MYITQTSGSDSINIFETYGCKDKEDIPHEDAVSIFDNCTFANINSTSSEASVMQIGSYTPVYIKNSIFKGNFMNVTSN